MTVIPFPARPARALPPAAPDTEGGRTTCAASPAAAAADGREDIEGGAHGVRPPGAPPSLSNTVVFPGTEPELPRFVRLNFHSDTVDPDSLEPVLDVAIYGLHRPPLLTRLWERTHEVRIACLPLRGASAWLQKNGYRPVKGTRGIWTRDPAPPGIANETAAEDAS